MKHKESREKLFTVVEVWRGVAIGATNFLEARKAEIFMDKVRGRRNMMEDDVQLFETWISAKARRRAR